MLIIIIVTIPVYNEISNQYVSAYHTWTYSRLSCTGSLTSTFWSEKKYLRRNRSVSDGSIPCSLSVFEWSNQSTVNKWDATTKITFFAELHQIKEKLIFAINHVYKSKHNYCCLHFCISCFVFNAERKEKNTNGHHLYEVSSSFHPFSCNLVFYPCLHVSVWESFLFPLQEGHAPKSTHHGLQFLGKNKTELHIVQKLKPEELNSRVTTESKTIVLTRLNKTQHC